MTDQHSPSRRRVLYGRRQGRRLRPTLRAVLDRRLPELVVAMPAAGSVLDPASLFPGAPRPVWLEIGFGGGEHLAAQADAHPGIGFLGAEPFVNGQASLAAHVDRLGLANVRILPDDARPLLEALPEASIARAFVLFPDPWPKRRHAGRRFIVPATLDALARVLEDGAELRIASDDPGYVQWILSLVPVHPAFRWTARRAEDWRRRPGDWPETRYEAKAIAAGRSPAFLRFLRRPRDEAPA